MNKTELFAKQTGLEERPAKNRKDLAGGLEADFAEQAVQLKNHDVLLEIARVTKEELLKIKAQLQDTE